MRERKKHCALTILFIILTYSPGLADDGGNYFPLGGVPVSLSAAAFSNSLADSEKITLTTYFLGETQKKTLPCRSIYNELRSKDRLRRTKCGSEARLHSLRIMNFLNSAYRTAEEKVTLLTAQYNSLNEKKNEFCQDINSEDAEQIATCDWLYQQLDSIYREMTVGDKERYCREEQLEQWSEYNRECYNYLYVMDTNPSFDDSVFASTETQDVPLEEMHLVNSDQEDVNNGIVQELQ